MSHFAKIKTQIKSIVALRAACKEMGFEVIDNSVARGYGSNTIPGEHVIRLKGPYDIAVNKERDGTYGLTCDWWDGRVEQEVGKDFGKLLQTYGISLATSLMKAKGFTVKRNLLANGNVELNAQRAVAGMGRAW